MRIWDRGTYETEKWTDREVKVVLHGDRVSGRYVLFRTGGRNWMVHRMDPRPAGFEPLPELIRPMMAVLRDELPADDDQWAYEMKWDGVRAVVYIEGGRPRALLAQRHRHERRLPGAARDGSDAGVATGGARR